jgi:hypothetical protein
MKKRHAAKKTRRPQSEAEFSPPMTRSRNALTLRWGSLTGGVQAGPLTRTAPLPQLQPQAGTLTVTTTEDPVLTQSEAGKKSLPGVTVVPNEQALPPPPVGDNDGIPEKKTGADLQAGEETASQESDGVGELCTGMPRLLVRTSDARKQATTWSQTCKSQGLRELCELRH